MSTPDTQPSLPESYIHLKEAFGEYQKLFYATEYFEHDSSTRMAPGSTQDRVEVVGAIATSMHRIIADPCVKGWLNEAEEKRDSLSPVNQRNLDLMHRKWLHEASLPENLAREVSAIESGGRLLYAQHKNSGDWSKMEGHYKRSFDTMREVGETIKDRLGVPTAYAALLDKFSPGLSVEVMERELAKVDDALRIIIPKALAIQNDLPALIPLPAVPADEIMILCNKLAAMTGFDFNRGVIATSPGVFSVGSPNDSRISVRIGKEDFLKVVDMIIHESGHSEYNQNLPQEHLFQLIGDDLGTTVQESQSVMKERFACRTDGFFEVLSRMACEVFNRSANDPALSPENLRAHAMWVQPSFIRTTADCLTYPAHVSLRVELEKAIIGGTLDVRDLPDAWNAGMKSRLGIVPPSHDKGCMQDPHWPAGAIGYFPAYVVGGNIMAAQFWAAANRARPEITTEIARGNFGPLNEWRKENVQSKGSILPMDELLVQATGEGLNADHVLDHLSQTYTGTPWSPEALA